MECCCVVSNDDGFFHLVRDSIEADNIDYFLSQTKKEQKRTADPGYYVIEYTARHNSTVIFLHLLSEAHEFNALHYQFLINNISKMLKHMITNSNDTMLSRTLELMHQNKIILAKARYPKVRGEFSSLFPHKSDNQSIVYFLLKYGLRSPPEFYDQFFTLCEFYKIPIAKVDHEGNTPLHVAAKNSNHTGAKYLIQKFRMSPLIKNRAGKTAFDLIPKGQKHHASFLQVYRELLVFLMIHTTVRVSCR